MSAYAVNVIGRFLINKVVKPVGEYKVSRASPAYFGSVFRVVSRKIIEWNFINSLKE